MSKLSKLALGPLHYFTAGGIATVVGLKAVQLIAKRSKTVEKVLNKGFGIVEGKVSVLKKKVMPNKANKTVKTIINTGFEMVDEKIDDLKEKVLPTENSQAV